MVRVVSPIPGVARRPPARRCSRPSIRSRGRTTSACCGLAPPGLSSSAQTSRGAGAALTADWATGRFAPARRATCHRDARSQGLLKPPTATCNAGERPALRRRDPPAPARPADIHRAAVRPAAWSRHSRGPGSGWWVCRSDSTFFCLHGGPLALGQDRDRGRPVHPPGARRATAASSSTRTRTRSTKIKAVPHRRGLRDRVVEINLAAYAGRNPAGTCSASPAESDARRREQVDAVVDAFAATLHWDERNTRALNLVTPSPRKR